MSKETTKNMKEGIQMNIDDEWASFVSGGYNNAAESDEEPDDSDGDEVNTMSDFVSADISEELQSSETPKASPIYISTKTNIAFLDKTIDLKQVFWAVPIISYANPVNGVVKKQIKLNSVTQEELETVQERLKQETYFEEHVITSINNPTGRITFKDIRKISIGISKKDLTSYRSKKKSAFYNCFVLIFRMKVDDNFKEFHVKVFNTGKVEIPGVQSQPVFEKVLALLIETLQPHMECVVGYKENSTETVLINSNFKCGFYINREALYDILRYKYNIQAIYDPCSYPGIQCKFYYNHDIGIQTGSQISEEKRVLHSNISEVSFMIFRTGSVLIVGKCDEYVLLLIYEFLKNILMTEYKDIRQYSDNANECNVPPAAKDKKKKIRKKFITVS
jgi:hypothetical protein